MTDSVDSWADALAAWVPLMKLLATVERHLGLPPQKSRDALRLSLETMRIRTVVVDGDSFQHRDGPQRNWVMEGETRRDYRVGREGWPHVLWESGTLAGREVRVYWDDVALSLVRIIERQRRELVEQTKQANQVRESPKGKGGRPPSPESDQFWIEIAIFTGINGLEAVDRTRLQKHMESWVIRTSKDDNNQIYSVDTIRGKLRPYVRAMT